MTKLRIAGLNMDIVWKNKEENFRTIENELSSVEADVYLLPEMFSTGFCMEADEVADKNLETLTWMKKFAQSTKTAVAGSASIEESGKFYNRFYFVFPDGNFEYHSIISFYHNEILIKMRQRIDFYVKVSQRTVKNNHNN